MASRGHPWANWLATLVRCRITIEYRNIYKTGGIFNSRKYGQAWLIIENVKTKPVFLANIFHSISLGETFTCLIGKNIPVDQHPMRNPKTGVVEPIELTLSDVDKVALVYIPIEAVRT